MFDALLSSLKADLTRFFRIYDIFDAFFSSLTTYVMHIFLIVICDALFALTSVMHFFLIEGKFDALPDT